MKARFHPVIRLALLTGAALILFSCTVQPGGQTGAQHGVTILSPVGDGQGYETSVSPVTVSGTANFTNSTVSAVKVISGVQTNTASGTSNWSFPVSNLAENETNKVSVYAAAGSGEVSAVKSIFIILINGSVTYQQFDELFDNTKIHRITFEFTPSEWSNLLNDYDHNPYEEVKRKANFIFKYNGSGPDERLDNIGLRFSGNAYSRIRPMNGANFQRFHMLLDFNYTFDLNEGYYSGSADLPPISNNAGRMFRGVLKSLKMKMEHSDPCMSLENFCYNMFRDAGVPAPRTTFARVYITVTGVTNDVYYGIYKIIEHIDKSFVTRCFGKMASAPHYGDLYKCLYQDYGPADLQSSSIADPLSCGVSIEETNTPYRPDYDLKISSTDGTDCSSIRAFINSLNGLTGAGFQSWIENNFEVSNFIKHLAITTLVGMTDSYWNWANNFYFYYNPVNGKWNFIPYDYDNTFDVLTLGSGGPMDSRDIDADGPVDGSRPLVNKLMAISKYKNFYHECLSNLMKTYFTLTNADAFFAIRNSFDWSWQALCPDAITPGYDYQSYMISRISNAAVQLGLPVSLFLAVTNGGSTNTNSNVPSDPWPSFTLLTNGSSLNVTNTNVGATFASNYKVLLTNGQTPVITLSNMTADFTLKFYDRYSNLLVASVNGGWTNEIVNTYTATNWAYFRVQVYISGNSTESNGCCLLSVVNP